MFTEYLQTVIQLQEYRLVGTFSVKKWLQSVSVKAPTYIVHEFSVIFIVLFNVVGLVLPLTVSTENTQKHNNLVGCSNVNELLLKYTISFVAFLFV